MAKINSEDGSGAREKVATARRRRQWRDSGSEIGGRGRYGRGASFAWGRTWRQQDGGELDGSGSNGGGEIFDWGWRRRREGDGGGNESAAAMAKRRQQARR